MGRAAVRKVFVTGLVVAIVGGVLIALSTRGGQGSSGGVETAGLLLAAAGGVIEVVSWILALVSTAVLHRWGWFVVVLVLGVIGLLLVVMIFYSIFGPSTRRDVQRPVVASS